jgi:16S rRNA (guanine966-N2)-methyltransferase
MIITTGIYKFKKIHTLKGAKLRPTSNKIRNAVFNILANKYIMSSWSKKAHLLDAFSGSGIVAFEGLSRNINKVTMIEADSTIFQNLKKNIEVLDLKKKVKLINDDFFNTRLTKNEYFLVYLDPPYLKNFTNLAIKKILDEKALKKGAIIVSETNKNYKYDKYLNQYIWEYPNYLLYISLSSAK